MRAAAQELGYRPNVAARALRTGVARSVALVVPDITNPFFGRVLRGAQRAAQQAGYTVVLVDLGNDRAWEEASLRALLAGPADGLLLFEVDLPPGATEHAIQIEMCPDRLPVVRLDVEAGVDLALDHLFELGHTRIGAPRVEFRRADLRPPARPVAQASRVRAAVGRSRRSPSRAPPRPSARCSTRAASRAIFCDDDILAGGVYLAARERGIDIPARAVGDRLRRPRLRARARAAADDGRGRRRGPRRGRLRSAGARDRRRDRRARTGHARPARGPRIDRA